MKKLIILSITVVLFAGLAYQGRAWYRNYQLQSPEAPVESDYTEIAAGEDLPVRMNIELPFYPQAPYGDWDYPWQEACEEASVLLVANIYKGMNLDRAAFNEELLRLVDWEVDHFGWYEHTSVEDTAEMMELNYGLETVIHEDPSFEDMQRILAKGHLIIAPFAGRELKNPNFTAPGPVYHMAVIKGYDAEKNHLVAHDVGTRNGANYVYTQKIIENSLHDLNYEDMLSGDPRIIEVLPPKNQE